MKTECIYICEAPDCYSKFREKTQCEEHEKTHHATPLARALLLNTKIWKFATVEDMETFAQDKRCSVSFVTALYFSKDTWYVQHYFEKSADDPDYWGLIPLTQWENVMNDEILLCQEDLDLEKSRLHELQQFVLLDQRERLK
jgi:hypothetical protein